jgi:arylsulfatase A-like enzyme
MPSVAEDVLRVPLGHIAGSLGTALPSVDPRGIHVLGDEVYAMALDDIDGETAPGQLTFIHLLIPHTPFIYDREGNITTNPNGTTARTVGYVSADVYSSYLRQVAYADTQLGRLIDRLEEEGIYDESVIILTGDHGLRLKGATPHEPLDIENQTAQVPFIVKAPGLSPAVTDVDYQHIDFGATVADVLGLVYDSDSVGVSAFAPHRPDREKVFFVDDDNKVYWTYVYDEPTGEWELTETVHGPLRDYSDDAIVKAPKDAPEHPD